MEEWQNTYWNTIVRFMADQNVMLDQVDMAVETSREIYANNPDSYDVMLQIIRFLQLQEKYSEIVECLESMGPGQLQCSTDTQASQPTTTRSSKLLEKPSAVILSKTPTSYLSRQANLI